MGNPDDFDPPEPPPDPLDEDEGELVCSFRFNAFEKLHFLDGVLGAP
jgi:hypothetical protein